MIQTRPADRVRWVEPDDHAINISHCARPHTANFGSQARWRRHDERRCRDLLGLGPRARPRGPIRSVIARAFETTAAIRGWWRGVIERPGGPRRGTTIYHGSEPRDAVSAVGRRAAGVSTHRSIATHHHSRILPNVIFHRREPFSRRARAGPGFLGGTVPAGHASSYVNVKHNYYKLNILNINRCWASSKPIRIAGHIYINKFINSIISSRPPRGRTPLESPAGLPTPPSSQHLPITPSAWRGSLVRAA